MKSLAKLSKSIGYFFDATAKARVQSTLLVMGRDWVERQGYCWEKLSAGVSQWPWREAPEAQADKHEIERAIRELKSFSDRELHDIGIHRSGIEYAVRFGRDGIDGVLEREKSAA